MGYDRRRRIRAQIRIVKRELESKKETTTTTYVKKVSLQYYDMDFVIVIQFLNFIFVVCRRMFKMFRRPSHRNKATSLLTGTLRRRKRRSKGVLRRVSRPTLQGVLRPRKLSGRSRRPGRRCRRNPLRNPPKKSDLLRPGRARRSKKPDLLRPGGPRRLKNPDHLHPGKPPRSKKVDPFRRRKRPDNNKSRGRPSTKNRPEALP